MKEILLTRGKVSRIDNADYPSVSRYKWQALKAREGLYYAVRTVKKDGKSRCVYLHRFLVPGKRIDHRDGDGLNNQRKNLRPSSHKQNLRAARRKPSGATSRFRGVAWYSASRKWAACIHTDGKTVHLGYFLVETDAARAYDAAARKYFGEFASPNFYV